MSAGRQKNWVGQQRVDIPHLREIESAVAADFDLLAGAIMAGKQALVVRGFDLLTTDAVGNAATSLQLNVANGILIHPLASENGSIFSVPSTAAVEVLSPSNAKVSGSFTASATNYVGIDLKRAADDTTADLVMILNASTLAEVPKTVPLGRTLDYRIVVSTTDFSATSHVLPIAKVKTDGANNVETIEDARQMFFRLGKGGSNPDRQSSYGWPANRLEGVVSATAFTGGDKGILSGKDFNDALMTRLWELGGGEYWYAATSDRDVKLCKTSTIIPATGDNFQWTLGSQTFEWVGLRFAFANSTGWYNDIADGTSSPLADNECLYVDIDRTTNRTGGTALVMAKALLTSLGAPEVPGSRFIIAWRQGDDIFVRDRDYEVGRIGNVATNIVQGTVRLSYAAGTPADPVVAPRDANGSILNTATANNAAGFAGVGHGTGAGISGTGGASGASLGGSFLGVTTGAGIQAIGGTGTPIAGTGAILTGGAGAVDGGNGATITGGTGADDGGDGIVATGGAGTGGAGSTGGIGVMAIGGAGFTAAEGGFGLFARGGGQATGVSGNGGTGGTGGIGVQGNGVLVGHGVVGVGGATSGDGVVGTGGGTGTGVVGNGGATNGFGGEFYGVGNGGGLLAQGGATGYGAVFVGGSTGGVGDLASGINIIAGVGALAIKANGGDIGGILVQATGNPTTVTVDGAATGLKLRNNGTANGTKNMMCFLHSDGAGSDDGFGIYSNKVADDIVDMYFAPIADGAVAESNSLRFDSAQRRLVSTTVGDWNIINFGQISGTQLVAGDGTDALVVDPTALDFSLVNVGGPTAHTAVTKKLTHRNIPRAWARIRIRRSGTSTFDTEVMDSFNVQEEGDLATRIVQLSGIWYLRVAWAGAFTNLDYSVAFSIEHSNATDLALSFIECSDEFSNFTARKALGTMHFLPINTTTAGIFDLDDLTLDHDFYINIQAFGM